MVGFVAQLYAQDPIQLPEVTVVAKNYKYLNKTDSKDATLPVKLLQQKVANYDVKSQDFYSENYDYYTVSFYIPEGKIVAAYDNDGKIVRTIEKYNNVRLPLEVLQAVAKRFPNWAVVEDVYLVNYHCDRGVKKQYKIKLKNEDKVVNVKTDEKGNFI